MKYEPSEANGAFCVNRETGGREKIKRLLPAHCSGSSHVHHMNVALQLVNWWRVALARFWHVCLEQTMLMMMMRKFFVYLQIFQKKRENKRNVQMYCLPPFLQTREFWSSKANWRLRFSLPSTILDILAELVENTTLLRRAQKVIVCDLWLVDNDPFCVFLCFKPEVCCLWS